MRCRILFISSGLVAVALGLTVLMLCNKTRGKVTVSFVNAEPSHGQFPSYKESVRLAFAIRNSGARNATIVVRAVRDEQGNWSLSNQMFGEVEARQSAQRYLYVPQGSHPSSVRVLVMKRANVIQKTQVALTLLVQKAAGRYRGKDFWLDRLIVGGAEFDVPLWSDSRPNDAGPGNQSIGFDTNHNTARAGCPR